MKTLLSFLFVAAVWFILQLWLLPRMGVPT